MNTVSGNLEIFPKGFGFLRDHQNNFRPKPTDPYVPFNLIQDWELREGLYIEGRVKAQSDVSKENLQIINIVKINEKPAKKYAEIKELKDRTSINPNERLRLALNQSDRLGRSLDLITPLGKGQRGMIIAAPKTGKTSILKHIARALAQNHPEIRIYVLLVDERPEEVTDFRRSLPFACVLSSSADEDTASHLRMTRLAMNTAMREAEYGCDVIVLIDSLTRMARAFNKETDSFSRTMTGGLGANAMELPRRFFGAARNIEHGGSLSVIATILIETGSKMDDIIFQEFKGTGNLDLVLSKACADRRIFPAININASGTRKEELLLGKEEYIQVAKLRRYLGAMDEVGAMSHLLGNLDKI